MKSKEPELVKLNVDEETKRYLEIITDRLSDAMIDFVKRDDLKQSLREIDMHLSELVERANDSQIRVLSAIGQSVEKVETIVAVIEKVQIRLNENMNKAVEHIATLEGQMSSLAKQLEQMNRPWWRKVLG